MGSCSATSATRGSPPATHSMPMRSTARARPPGLPAAAPAQADGFGGGGRPAGVAHGDAPPGEGAAHGVGPGGGEVRPRLNDQPAPARQNFAANTDAQADRSGDRAVDREWIG